MNPASLCELCNKASGCPFAAPGLIALVPEFWLQTFVKLYVWSKS